MWTLHLTKPTTKEGNIYEYMLMDETKVVSLLSYINKGRNGLPLLLKVESFHVKMSSYPSKVNPKF